MNASRARIHRIVARTGNGNARRTARAVVSVNARRDTRAAVSVNARRTARAAVSVAAALLAVIAAGAGSAQAAAPSVPAGRSVPATRPGPAAARTVPAAVSSCGTADVAQGQPATASSTESGQFPATAAVDGSAATRWSSAWSDPQWIQVDLGSVQSICQVVLNWQNPAYGSAYQIQVSADAASWTTIYSTTTGAGGNQTLNVTGSGRYVRMYGTARASGYGYSLWEFGVYAGTGGGGSGGGGSPPPAWTPVWSDTFAGGAGSAPSAANWITDTGTTSATGAANWGTGEVETMSGSTSNVYLDGQGHLDITALSSGGTWTSGRVETQRNDFAAPPGGEMMISASIKQPSPASGLGYWPKFFTLGAGYRSNPSSWPAVGESDIMEDVNARSESSETLHCGTAPAGNCQEYNGRTSGLSTCAGCQAGYHTYAEVIDRTTSNEQIRYSIDGRQVWVVKESDVGASTWQAAIDHGFSIVLDLAIGGSYPNAVCGCTSPPAATSSGGTLSIGALSVQTSTGTAPPPYTTPPMPSGPSVVKVTGSSLGSYGVSVNGAPYQMKGVTFGPASTAASAYMPDLQAMGVNTIRTWGTDSTTQPLLDAAAPYGIRVINGFWLSQSADYVSDSSYKSSTEASILASVNQYKNSPAVLMWDIGNEVLLNLPNVYSGAQLTAEETAYAQYVDQIAVAIHQADPDHPVTSTDAWRPGIFQYYQANAPHLDLIAVNDYGDVCNLKGDWSSDGFTKPYIVTESGPAGEWEVPNDANGVPAGETDQQNAAGYAAAWGCITGNPGISLGGTLFNYGIENDFGGVWYNLVPGGWKRLSYDEVTTLFRGTAPADTAPVISSLTVGQDSAVPAGGQFTVSASASDPDGDPLSYNLMLNSKYVDGSTGLQYATFAQTGAGTFTVTAPKAIGVWKVYLYAYDGQGNVGVQTESFRVVPPPVSGTDVALGKPTTASSYQATGTGAPYPPSSATDGSDTTRWASDWSDPQWLEVDLGQVTAISHVQLVWEAAYATAYQIQVSTDGTNWTTIYSTATGTGNVEDLSVTGSGRYVRLYGIARGTSYGYSLYEFGVYQA